MRKLWANYQPLTGVNSYLDYTFILIILHHYYKNYFEVWWGCNSVKFLCKNVQESPEQNASVCSWTCTEDSNVHSEDILADLHNLKQLFEDQAWVLRLSLEPWIRSGMEL